MTVERPFRIVVAGGVAGGMSAAARARRLDENASIIVLEKGLYVSYANCGVPYALGGIIQSDDSLILQTESGLEDRFNIDVRMRSELHSINPDKHEVAVHSLDTAAIYYLPYDKLILAQGAESFRPPIDGIQQPHVFTLQTIPDLQAVRNYITEHQCQRAAIIGGGFIGLEAAENLHQLGLQVSILEAARQVFSPLDRDMAELLHRELRRNNVRVILGATVVQIKAREVMLGDGTAIPAEVVIAAVGVRARSTVAKEAGLAVGRTGVSVNIFMQTSNPDIYAVGDMVETENRISHLPQQLALGGPANRQGRLAADHIFGRVTPYRGNLGTFICKIFDLSAAVTGLSVKALRDVGYSPLWVTVHPPDHAAYYPNAAPMTLRVAFEPGSGKLLGAQAVGRKGIDKRIDTLSVALQAGMSIFDLEHAELGYAPPYGAAKDPVNMVGFVGSNILRGDSVIVHPEDISPSPHNFQIVDVRSPSEFERGHIPSALNIPINTLRKNASILDKTRPVIVYCWVGYRGYLAYRILHQLGYSAFNLDGGFKLATEGGFKDLHELPAN